MNKKSEKNNDLTLKIINLLNDKNHYTIGALSQALATTTSKIKICLNQMLELNVKIIHNDKGEYSLKTTVELLECTAIQELLTASIAKQLTQLWIFPLLDSTNQYLLNIAKQQLTTGVNACFAEYQNAGRGRRGRGWYAPFAQSLLFSVLWPFQQSGEHLTGLSIAMGISLLRALEKLGIKGLALKWPNDLLYDNKKLAGIGIEAFTDSAGVCHAVIGIGLNTHKMPVNPQISQPFISLEEISEAELSRNMLAATLLESLIIALNTFSTEGLAPFQSTWQAYDFLKDKPITVHDAQHNTRSAIARGIHKDGSLIIEDESGQLSFLQTGEVSVRVSFP